jgi:Na+/melibiose symporter-like transporter
LQAALGDIGADGELFRQGANILGVILASPIANKRGKKNTYLAAMIVAGVLSILFYWLGKEQLALIFVFQILISACAGRSFHFYGPCMRIQRIIQNGRPAGAQLA